MGPIHEMSIERLCVEKLEDRLTPSLSLVGVPGADQVSSPLVFAGFDIENAPGDFHPNFNRSVTAVDATEATADHNPTAAGNPEAFGNEGPWSAHYMSPVISCTVEPDCPADPTPYVPHP